MSEHKETRSINYRKLWSGIWPVIVLLAYIALNVFLLAHHENWRDEAQAWQIAKLCNLKELFAQLKYEGHPCLWYLLLMPFAKLGFPYKWMGYISLALMSGAVWLILKKAPLAVPVKLVLIFSPFFVYYYPVIARSYSLVPLILAVLASLYPKRHEKPLAYGIFIALLTQTHAYMVAMSFALSFSWLCETIWIKARKKDASFRFGRNAAGLSISLASALFLIWELIGSTDLNPNVDIQLASTLSSNLHRLSVGGQWTADFALGIGISDSAWDKLTYLLILCLVILVCFAWKEGMILAFALTAQVVLFTYVYLPSTQKAILLAHEIIFAVWIISEKQGRELPERWRLPAFSKDSLKESLKRLYLYIQRAGWQIALICLGLIAMYGHDSTIKKDVSEPYSAAEDAAAFIEENIPEDAVLVTAGDFPAFSIVAYLPDREIYYPVIRDYITYAVWNEERLTYISVQEMYDRIGEEFPDCESFYLITCGWNFVSGITDEEGMELLFEEDAIESDENCKIWYVEF